MSTEKAGPTEKRAGLTAELSKDLEVGYKERSAKAVEVQWKKSDDRVGTLPFNLDQTAGSSSIDPTQAFLSAMGITSEEINRLKKKLTKRRHNAFCSVFFSNFPAINCFWWFR